MRHLFLVLLLISLASWGQTATTGKASTTGLCSPAVTGNSNTFTISCGIGRVQGQQMLAVLNKILENGLDPSAVMQKLDEMSTAVRDLRQNPPDPNRGLLFPANDPSPFVDDWCEAHAPKDSFRLYLGRGYFATSAGFPATAIRIHGKPVLEFKQQAGGIAVSASVSNLDGKRIALVRDNYFKLGDYFRKETPDASTLNVFDESDDQPVLHLRYLNPRAILVTGTFSEDGITVVVDDKQGIKTNSRHPSLFASGACSIESPSDFDFN